MSGDARLGNGAGDTRRDLTTMRYLPTPCNCAECRANRRRNARLTMRLAPLLVVTAILTGWLILRFK
ncbi:hypothetical protein SuUB7_20590 [Streptococcus uberis]